MDLFEGEGGMTPIGCGKSDEVKGGLLSRLPGTD